MMLHPDCEEYKALMEALREELAARERRQLLFGLLWCGSGLVVSAASLFYLLF